MGRFSHRQVRLRHFAVTAGCAGLMLSIAGCGDDDDDASDDPFCTAGPAVDAALAPDEPDPAAVEQALAAAEAAAPEELTDEVETAAAAVREVFETQNFDAFETDEVQDALTAMNEFYVSDCGFGDRDHGDRVCVRGRPGDGKRRPGLAASVERG